MTEAQLIDKFEEYLISRFQREVFLYKVYSCGYTKVGFPDLVLALKGKLILIEAKKDEHQKLRPSQIAMHRLLATCGVPVYILFDKGYKLKDEVFYDETPFSAIGALL